MIDRPPNALYPLSLHDALPICEHGRAVGAVRLRGPDHLVAQRLRVPGERQLPSRVVGADHVPEVDRKSTRLNSSHVEISYAVFCLKKKRLGGATARAGRSMFGG